MDATSAKMAPQTSLFQVFLRLRPPQVQKSQQTEPWLLVEPPSTPATVEDTAEPKASFSTHITLQPPNDSRKRAIERFGFTKIFQEAADQVDIFEGSGAAEGIQHLLQRGRDGLIATLGVTGSGKSHTILGTRSQRGLTQMALDVLFRSIGSNVRKPHQLDLLHGSDLISTLQSSDASEAQILAATTFLEMVYDNGDRARMSRAQTPLTGYGSRAQSPLMETSHSHRRPPMPQPSTFAQSPDVSNFLIDVDRDADYVVLVSMYEVYNDRIFDLLSIAGTTGGPAMSTRAGAALQKGLMRRPLLFKNTEMSQDRKVVAGLRKIVCSSYEEAMMVLETGLTERRVAGTGSNSVSSRSHGFFCIEVKKNSGNRHFQSHSEWSGGTLSIADLAGSERARNAKTTGSTLAEAGKINESLMYLGQCLQVQSDCQQDGSKPIVPFRQCKLTELLFSNSFPSQSNQATSHRAPQKAIMIVTADPHGDFNATSQILRYSALAREVTVPRIPSVASVIVNGSKHSQDPSSPGDRFASNDKYLAAAAQELEQATNEVRRLVEECDALAIRLAEEEIKRTEAELKLQVAEERIATMEQDTREECWQEMEMVMEEEKERWRTAWEEQRMRGEEYLDGKIDILEKTSQFKIHEDVDQSARTDELERENEVLRSRLAALKQEMVTRSPTKKSKAAAKTAAPMKSAGLPETGSTNLVVNPFLASLLDKENEIRLKPASANTVEEIDVFEVSPRKLSLRNSHVTKLSVDEPATAKKKTRKLTTRKWDVGDESEI